MRRWLAAIAVVLLAAAAAWYFLIREKTAVATVTFPTLAGTIGAGEEEIVVAADGRLIRWLAPPENLALPALPDAPPPKRGRFEGPMREQAQVLGAVPIALRRYVARSFYGETGVSVELTSGIELRFGDASQAARKWEAAAGVLADPSIEALDYVNVLAPGHPAFGGEGHLLPPVE